jgi:hypothetical protein
MKSLSVIRKRKEEYGVVVCFNVNDVEENFDDITKDKQFLNI